MSNVIRPDSPPPSYRNDEFNEITIADVVGGSGIITANSEPQAPPSVEKKELPEERSPTITTQPTRGPTIRIVEKEPETCCEHCKFWGCFFCCVCTYFFKREYYKLGGGMLCTTQNAYQGQQSQMTSYPSLPPKSEDDKDGPPAYVAIDISPIATITVEERPPLPPIKPFYQECNKWQWLIAIVGFGSFIALVAFGIWKLTLL